MVYLRVCEAIRVSDPGKLGPLSRYAHPVQDARSISFEFIGRDRRDQWRSKPSGSRRPAAETRQRREHFENTLESVRSAAQST